MESIEVEGLGLSEKMKELLEGTLCPVEKRLKCGELLSLCVFEEVEG